MRKVLTLFIVALWVFSHSNIALAESPLYHDSAQQLINSMAIVHNKSNNDILFSNVNYVGLSEESGTTYDVYAIEYGTLAHIVKLRFLCDKNTGFVMKTKVKFDIQDKIAKQYSDTVTDLLEHELGLTAAEHEALWASVMDIRDDLFVSHVRCGAIRSEMQLIISLENERIMECSFSAI
ncbi:hypothetical protein [uncultured Anaerovibrio sp.]|uniref:hypothetical protein n=1 Tax=uncultured Anaerovibrio sp. TaxID=361586 RepID=UPI00262AD40B|nr:hypothetical protein [uncultured Anaerovibrio sp.]